MPKKRQLEQGQRLPSEYRHGDEREWSRVVRAAFDSYDAERGPPHRAQNLDELRLQSRQAVNFVINRAMKVVLGRPVQVPVANAGTQG